MLISVFPYRIFISPENRTTEVELIYHLLDVHVNVYKNVNNGFPLWNFLLPLKKQYQKCLDLPPPNLPLLEDDTALPQ